MKKNNIRNKTQRWENRRTKKIKEETDNGKNMLDIDKEGTEITEYRTTGPRVKRQKEIRRKWRPRIERWDKGRQRKRSESEDWDELLLSGETSTPQHLSHGSQQTSHYRRLVLSMNKSRAWIFLTKSRWKNVSRRVRSRSVQCFLNTQRILLHQHRHRFLGTPKPYLFEAVYSLKHLFVFSCG